MNDELLAVNCIEGRLIKFYAVNFLDLLEPHFFRLVTNFQCNSECYCDYVKYSPVCSQDGHTPFISACHAGCTKEHVFPNGSKVHLKKTKKYHKT